MRHGADKGKETETMMRSVTFAALAVAAGLIATPAAADCSQEVALAVMSQGKQPFLRKETNMITENGPVKMTVEYQTPNRMRQIVEPVGGTGPRVESIVVDEKAWTNSGHGWTLLPPAETDMLLQYMIKSIAQVYQEVGKFECLGAETLEGAKVRTYRGIDPDPPEDMPEEMKGMKSSAQKNEAVRLVYLDPETGLPVRSILARAGFLDKPLFKEVYTYPDKIEIEPPKDVVEPPKADGAQ